MGEPYFSKEGSSKRSKGLIKCPQCKKLNNERAHFCRHCGSPLFEHDSTSNRLPIGTVLDDRYKIIDYVAKGGMGAVYKAVDLKNSGFWAIKEMLDYFDSEVEREYAVERFTTEARILYKLNHDSIPKFVDCFVSENRYYLIMEFINGTDLKKLLDDAIAEGKKGLDERDVLGWAIQACDVLDYLHKQDPPIVYRDMKPGNIMVTPQNKVYLIDFGIARLFDPRTKGTMVGTQGYAPPEQYKGLAEPRSDLYSLAACIHHLLSGKDPRNDIPFNFAPVRNFRTDLSEGIEAVLDRALSMDPEDRYENMSEMKSVLIEVLKSLKEQEEKPDEPLIARKLRKIVASSGLPDFNNAKLKKYQKLVKSSSWHTFRMDNRRTGKSPFGKNIKGKLKWSYNVGSPIRSSPALGADGTIYVGANNGKIYAISPDGEKKWEFQTKARVHSSPAIGPNGVIYVGSNDCSLYALSPEGRLLWKFKTYGRIRSSPCIGRNGVIYFGSYDHYFYSVSPSGKLKWRLDLGGNLEATPAISEDGGIYVANKGAFNGGSYLYRLDGDGEIKWYSRINGPVRSSPCVANDGKIYIADMSGVMYCFSEEGKLLWLQRAGGAILSSPLLDEGRAVIFASFDRKIYAISPTGALLWNNRTNSSIASSPAMGGNRHIYVGSDDYYLYAISPEGAILWRLKAGNRIRSSPTIGEGETIYFGSDDGFLYAIE